MSMRIVKSARRTDETEISLTLNLDGSGIYDVDTGCGFLNTPGWATARTEWWNMLQRVGSGEDVETAVKTFVDNANAAAQA